MSADLPFRIAFLRRLLSGEDKLYLEYSPQWMWEELSKIGYQNMTQVQTRFKKKLTLDEAAECWHRAFFSLIEKYKQDTVRVV